jgi:glycerol-3-phosphate acyltransferase PlsY
MALDLVVAAISLAAMVASLGHVVKVFTGGGGKGVAGLSGADFDDAQGRLQRKP